MSYQPYDDYETPYGDFEFDRFDGEEGQTDSSGAGRLFTLVVAGVALVAIGIGASFVLFGDDSTTSESSQAPGSSSTIAQAAAPRSTTNLEPSDVEKTPGSSVDLTDPNGPDQTDPTAVAAATPGPGPDIEALHQLEVSLGEGVFEPASQVVAVDQQIVAIDNSTDPTEFATLREILIRLKSSIEVAQGDPTAFALVHPIAVEAHGHAHSQGHNH